jgi:hypothetical protein
MNPRVNPLPFPGRVKGIPGLSSWKAAGLALRVPIVRNFLPAKLRREGRPIFLGDF